MKYIYLSLVFIVLFSTLKAQNMSLFLKATESGWYPEFLKPVVASVDSTKKNQKILDIGTGPGTLPKLLFEKDSSRKIIGIDIDESMIQEAQKRNTSQNIVFEIQKLNIPLEFKNEEFDVVTFCSVLFLVDDSTKTKLIEEALRIVKPTGKIIILTPSGKKAILGSFVEVWKYRFSMNNFTFPIWKIATTSRARQWNNDNWLKKYAEKNQLEYKTELTFNDNASIEIITK